MTVEDAIITINRVHESIRLLDCITIEYELKNEYAIAVTDAISDLEHYIDDLRRKTVK